MEFGKYGGQFVHGAVLEAVREVEQAFNAVREDAGFKRSLRNCFTSMPIALHLCILPRT
jgi:tryptophan synthase beta subunit